MGFDPGLCHWGIAHATVEVATLLIVVTGLRLIATINDKHKQVRRNSDLLKRAALLSETVHREAGVAQLVFSEIPSGAQNASANMSFGIVIGILGGMRVPIIQLLPAEVKLATVGKRTASKPEMIEWAVAQHPDAPWVRSKRKGKLVLHAVNEHLADATAVIYAGIKTDQFRQAVSLQTR
jgi:Holliday junction resolvasome RuvABC endonuclease subunit